MNRFDRIYGGKWLKACDLDGEKHQLQINAADWKEVGRDREEKLVLEFINSFKPLILNATNARRVAERYGKQEVAWQGKWVEAVQTETAFGPGIQLTPIDPPAVVEAVPF